MATAAKSTSTVPARPHRQNRNRPRQGGELGCLSGGPAVNLEAWSPSGTFEETIQLFGTLANKFNYVAKKLDKKRKKVDEYKKAAYIASGFAAGGTALTLLTAGASLLVAGVAGAAVGAALLALYTLISTTVDTILKDSELSGMHDHWIKAKEDYKRSINITEYSDQSILDWAQRNLDRDEAAAIEDALRAARAASPGKKFARVKKMREEHRKKVMETLTNIVLADFTESEIMFSALKDQPTGAKPGEVVRILSRQFDQQKEKIISHKEEAERKIKEEERLKREKEEQHKKELPIKQLLTMNISIPPEPPHESLSNSSSKPTAPHDSLLTTHLKDKSIEDKDVLTSTQHTQIKKMNRERDVTKPLLSDKWQHEDTFTDASKCMSKQHSGVTLTVPAGAVGKGDYRLVYMAVCTNIKRIHQLLEMDDIYVASPLAEFRSKDELAFTRPVQICLPHVLSMPDDLDHVQVVRVTTDAFRKVKLQRLIEESHGKNTITEGAAAYNSELGTFHVRDDGKIYITTTHFSAYVCLVCGHHNVSSSTVFVLGFGTNTPQKNGCSLGTVGVAVGDKRLKLQDFQPENVVFEPQRLLLPTTTEHKDPHLGMQLELGSSKTAVAWELIRYGTETQPVERRLRLRGILFCENQQCQTREDGDVPPDRSTKWQLETTEQSSTAPWIQCKIAISYMSGRDASTTSSFIDLTMRMEVEPSEQSTPENSPNVTGLIRNVENLYIGKTTVYRGGDTQPLPPQDLQPTVSGAAPLPLPTPVSTQEDDKDNTAVKYG